MNAFLRQLLRVSKETGDALTRASQSFVGLAEELHRQLVDRTQPSFSLVVALRCHGEAGVLPSEVQDEYALANGSNDAIGDLACDNSTAGKNVGCNSGGEGDQTCIESLNEVYLPYAEQHTAKQLPSSSDYLAIGSVADLTPSVVSKGRSVLPLIHQLPHTRISAGHSNHSQVLGMAASLLTSRLAEVESPWFLADVVAGEERLTAADADNSPFSATMVMVSSVDSLSSIGDEDDRSAADVHVDNGTLAIPEISLTKTTIQDQFLPEMPTVTHGTMISGFVRVADSLAAVPISAVYIVQGRAGRTEFKSLKEMLTFVRHVVSTLGSDVLRGTRFITPSADAEDLLKALESLMLLSVNDIIGAARAAASPVALAIAARYFIVQLSEITPLWLSLSEASAGATAAVGEAVMAGASTGTVAFCNTIISITPWVILVGGCIFAVVKFWTELKETRRKRLSCRPADVGDCEDGLCIQSWEGLCVVELAESEQ